MLEIRGGKCKTSFVKFSRPQRKDIFFLSMSHFGTSEYFQSIQGIIDSHEGPIIYEFAEKMGEEPPFEEFEEPQPKKEESKDTHKIMAELLGLLPQSHSLVLPSSRVYAPNYSSEEVIEFAPSFLEVMQELNSVQEKFTEICKELGKNPEIGRRIFFFLDNYLWRKDVSTVTWRSREGLIAGGKREKDFLCYLERLAQREFSAEEKKVINTLCGFSRIPNPVLYDVFLTFREKKLLELVNQVEDMGSPLIIYGAGHYYNVAKELRASGYTRKVIQKLVAFSIPKVEIGEFLEAIHALMNLCPL